MRVFWVLLRGGIVEGLLFLMTLCPVTLAPPLPIYAFTLVANLREKNAKGYPVKKVLSPYVATLHVLNTTFTAPFAALENHPLLFWRPERHLAGKEACPRH